ncbi:MAG: rod shape-determining protein RodA [Sedimentisphaerales bacterium]|nr:rod shape-determining protein RodA [Sedimentisphaerales bacterium]
MYNFFSGRLLFVRLCLIAAALGLVAVGIVTIYSVGHPAEATVASDTAKLSVFWKKQVVFAAVAILGFIVVNSVSYRRLGSASYWLYGIILVLLTVLLISRYISPLPFAPARNYTHRWIQFSFGGRELPAVQPSELCKLGYIVALAWYLRYRSNYRSFKSLVGPFVLTLVPMVMILLEPDLGTVMLMMPILITMLFVAGAKVKHFLIVVLMAVMVSPLLWYKMNLYQRTRVSSVLLQSGWVRDKAERYPTLGRILVGGKFSEKQWKNDWGYQMIRSKYAIASGGAKGYGFRKGPFIKYNFLPERYNDFIFATIAHQWGFVGCLALLGLYVIIIGCGLEIAAHNTDPFGRLLAIGIVAMFVVEVIVNVSMTMGLMPITGLTLPLVSYGGSSLLVSMMSIGLLNNVGRWRAFTVAPKPFEQQTLR